MSTTPEDRPLVAMSGGDLAISEDQHSWSSAQIAALAQLGLKDADDSDLQVFFHVVQKTGLDPFARQVYMIYRNDPQSPTGRKATIQTGIDGGRLVAQRAARRDRVSIGYEDTLYRKHDGTWTDCWDDPDLNPVAVKVTVLRDGQRYPHIAHWREYVQTYKGNPNRMWSQMPANQLAKCSEMGALRKAFPQDLSGVYEQAEIPTGPGAGVSIAPPDIPNPEALPVDEAVRGLYEQALAHAGDGAALAKVWADGRAANLLDESVTHQGTKGKLGNLILHLRTAPKGGGDVVDAEVVDDPKPPKPKVKAGARRQEPVVVEFDEMTQPVRAMKDTPLPSGDTLACGCDTDTVWRTGEHGPDCTLTPTQEEPPHE